METTGVPNEQRRILNVRASHCILPSLCTTSMVYFSLGLPQQIVGEWPLSLQGLV